MDNQPGEIKKQLITYQQQVRQELDEILSYWVQNTPDDLQGGFKGRIDENNNAVPGAPKGVVLNGRILWVFSSAYTITKDPLHLQMADRAFNYIRQYFIDEAYGGVYWSVDAAGSPLDTKKQIYALAFTLYGCSAYHSVSLNANAKNIAIRLFKTIEQYSYDDKYTGYLEAFTKDWQPIGDLRLSAKDANEKKSMNTHLHVLEAYTALYKIWPDEKLQQQQLKLINNFTRFIIDDNTSHLKLFFDETWVSKSTIISYGHDIEAAWLLLEAAEVLGDATLIKEVQSIAVNITAAAAEGLDEDGGLWYEYEPDNNHLIKEKHWWVQAEAMIGFFNDWQITANLDSLQKSINAWIYIGHFIKDKQYGEWYWGRNGQNEVMPQQDKAGIWKCPYHNARACMEIINRVNSHLNF